MERFISECMPRWVNHIYANMFFYFWLPCPLCDEMFGGHEWKRGGTLMTSMSGGKGVCVNCKDKALVLNTERYGKSW